MPMGITRTGSKSEGPLAAWRRLKGLPATSDVPAAEDPVAAITPKKSQRGRRPKPKGLTTWSVAADLIQPGLVAREVRYHLALACSGMGEDLKSDQSRAKRIGVTKRTLSAYVTQDPCRVGSLDPDQRRLLAEIVCGSQAYEPWLSEGIWGAPDHPWVCAPAWLKPKDLFVSVVQFGVMLGIGNLRLAIRGGAYHQDALGLSYGHRLREEYLLKASRAWPTWADLTPCMDLPSDPALVKKMAVFYHEMEVKCHAAFQAVVKDCSQIGEDGFPEPDLSLSHLWSVHRSTTDRHVAQFIAAHPEHFISRQDPELHPTPAPSPRRRNPRSR